MKGLVVHVKKLPIGLRMIKSALAVMLAALLVKLFFNKPPFFDDTPFFACIGAVVAVEKSMTDSFRMSIIRNVGTLVGGLTGILASLLFAGLVSANSPLLGIGVIPVIFACLNLKKHESIVPGCIVYFAVVFLNTTQTAWDYGFSRIIQTFIGSIIGLCVNYFILPPKKKEDKDSR